MALKWRRLDVSNLSRTSIFKPSEIKLIFRNRADDNADWAFNVRLVSKPAHSYNSNFQKKYGACMCIIPYCFCWLFLYFANWLTGCFNVFLIWIFFPLVWFLFCAIGGAIGPCLFVFELLSELLSEYVS